MIDWDIIPKHIVAIDAHNDFSGGSFYTLNREAISISDESEHVLRKTFYEEGSIDTLLSVRPSATLDIVNALLKNIEALKNKIEELEKEKAKHDS